jgi:hypothetical protein
MGGPALPLFIELALRKPAHAVAIAACFKAAVRCPLAQRGAVTWTPHVSAALQHITAVHAMIVVARAATPPLGRSTIQVKSQHQDDYEATHESFHSTKAFCAMLARPIGRPGWVLGSGGRGGRLARHPSSVAKTHISRKIYFRSRSSP